jgi:putative NADH-flavin reductase
VSAKRILVLGATGGTGRQVLVQAAERDREITVLVRDPRKLPKNATPLRVLTGDLLHDPDVLTAALAGQDAVISALGVGLSFKPGGLISGGAPLLVAAMKHQGVRRLVFTSALGVGATRRNTPVLVRLFSGTLLRDVYADKERGERSIVSSDLDWTIVYPAGLTNGPRTGRYRIGERLPLRGIPLISRADVAEVLLDQVDDRTYIRKGLVVAG